MTLQKDASRRTGNRQHHDNQTESNKHPRQWINYLLRMNLYVKSLSLHLYVVLFASVQIHLLHPADYNLSHTQDVSFLQSCLCSEKKKKKNQWCLCELEVHALHAKYTDDLVLLTYIWEGQTSRESRWWPWINNLSIRRSLPSSSLKHPQSSLHVSYQSQ